MVLTLESADEIPCCDNSNETSWLLDVCVCGFFFKAKSGNFVKLIMICATLEVEGLST